LIHPRLERSDSERLAAPELATLTERTLATSTGGADAEPVVPDDPGIGAFDGLGGDEDETPPSAKNAWLKF
jgi:hypothetical protein